ncbi:MAG: glycoside hydrolase family 5 protein, partial [Duncaniella sp.]|nr:glycoside hydrolase family 5 protein [Duncaniella sp.]
DRSWNSCIVWSNKYNFSVVMWDIADKNETCSMILPTASDNGMEWKEEEMKEWAKLAKSTISERNN